MKYIIVIYFFLTSVFASEFYFQAIPKSGSHLLLKALHLLDYPNEPVKHFLPHPDNYRRESKFFRNHPSSTIFYFVRDPRDVLVSILNANRHLPEQMAASNKNWDYFGINANKKPKWKTMTDDEKLLSMIEMNNDCALKIGQVTHTGFQLAHDFKNYHNIIILRFEDLVGEKGGGSLFNQIRSLEKICLYTNFDKNNIPFVVEKAFGPRLNKNNRPILGETFHKGQIGTWKKYFKPMHIKAFKKNHNWNKFLIKLGYEKNKNWDNK